MKPTNDPINDPYNKLYKRHRNGDRCATLALTETIHEWSKWYAATKAPVLLPSRHFEDVGQDVAVEMLKPDSRFDPNQGLFLRSALFWIRNKTVDEVRKHQRAPCEDIDTDEDEPDARPIASDAASPEAAVAAAERVARIHQRIPADQLNLIVGKHVLGWTHEEFAEFLGIRNAAARARLSRALAAVRLLVPGAACPSDD